MVIGNRKEEGRVCNILFLILLEKPSAQREQICCNSERKKAKSVPGFEPSLFRQNATALPLVPPPQPLYFDQGFQYIENIHSLYKSSIEKSFFLKCTIMAENETNKSFFKIHQTHTRSKCLLILCKPVNAYWYPSCQL